MREWCGGGFCAGTNMGGFFLGGLLVGGLKGQFVGEAVVGDGREWRSGGTFGGKYRTETLSHMDWMNVSECGSFEWRWWVPLIGSE